jgi:hypothetical protein
MTDLIIERLRIACTARHGREREALAVRARLERIARRRLPATLERTVPASGAESFGRIVVMLDFDPSDYDDETVALRWAERIRRAVGRSSPLAPFGAATVEAGSVSALSRHPRRTPPAEELLVAVLDRALVGESSALDELAAILDSGRAKDDLELLSAGELRVLAEQLERYAGRLEAAAGAAEAESGSPRRDGVASAPAREARGRRIHSLRTAERAKALRGAARALRHREGRVVGGRGPRGAALAPALLSSSVAGIVLLYPWLGRFLSDATEAQPDLDPVPVRRLALARLVPDVAAADSDPLVRFLAGGDPNRDESPLAPPTDTRGVDEQAASVLRSFAEALPGFESSSAEFIRRQFIVRRGTLATDPDPAQLVVAALPLDPVLVRLPYPIGLVRLAWTASLSVRIES